MAHQWKAGDLAVCVKEGGWRRIDGTDMGGHHPAYRATVRVASVSLFRGEIVVLHLDGYHEDGYCAHRFRPIEPAEPSFTKAMRELRPLVEA